MIEDPAAVPVAKVGGRKFAFLIILTAILGGFVAAVIFCPRDQLLLNAFDAFMSIYMFIAISVVAGNVIEKVPWKRN